jgi:hypothetical protein
MKASEFVSEKWSRKYKRSINCASPRGFSQRAHCAGRRKTDEATGANYNTARSIAQDIHDYVLNIGQTISLQGSKGRPYVEQLQSEMLPMIEELRALGYDYHPEARDYMVPLTVDQATDPRLTEEQLDEILMFRGSPCTVDCSGHRAGYEWWFRKRKTPNSWSPSFNKGAALAAAGK